jgi:hypothetical protein
MMAKCDLSIELDEPDKFHLGGDTITGVIRVNVDADVNCKGLEVASGWRTHGRGNVASGTSESVTVFAGEWKAGDQIEYRFELAIAHWPPSYHGGYLNVDHYIDARAKIPWGFDPKASQPFMMRPTNPDEVSKGTGAIEVKGLLKFILGGVLAAFFVGFLVMLAAMGPFALLFLILPIIGFFIWLFRVFLPRWALGEVECELAEENVAPGDTVQGELIIRPRKNVGINGVSLNFEAREQVVSGSGSNQTTHKNVFFEKKFDVQEAITLKMGQEHRFPLSVQIPEDAPYSIELNDNKLIWSTTLRVDIPRWPDWVKTLPLFVLPTLEQLQSASASQGQPVGATEVTGEPSSQGGITFAETANHLWSVRGNRDQVETLVDAVSGLTFDIEAVTERRLLYSGDEDPHVYKDGYAVWAHFTDPELPMVLYVPHELADEFEHMGDAVCRGRGTVVGWDSLHERLQVKLERPE